MEIKVGELVRTHKGIIGTLQSQELTYPEPSEWILDVNGKEVIIVECDDYITKHSFNLIDLIEVGDILEIELSEEFVERKDKKVFTRIGDVYTKEALQKDMDNGIIQEIKQILTHEQFESNAYKVKGEW